MTDPFSRDAVLSALKERNPDLDLELVGRAYEYCQRAHTNQLRKSGVPYIQHPVEVAKILAKQRMGADTIAAGLLHDVVEDSDLTVEDVERDFGTEIAYLVDGVTKITEIQMVNRQQRQAETFRKMLLSMARDIRVILIKFADRLHNLRTLQFLERDQIRNVANETLEVYAPLAHRLGMAQMKAELEDLGFQHLHPNEYKDLVRKMKDTQEDRDQFIRRLLDPLQEKLAEEGVDAVTRGRSKHYYSIYRKITQRGVPFDEIFDLLALRIVTEKPGDCYAALGVVHSLWHPIPARFKDYIASPKSNLYQSIHTTVVTPEGKMVELQIRTREMHRTAEAGIAAHWHYKEGRGFNASDEHVVWLRQMEEWQRELSDSNEFLEFLKIDLFPAEVFIFSPKGDVIQLPKGATALDFAFSIHTDLGLHCIGCKINSKVMPIDTPLKSGSTVEILRSENQRPNMEWLRYVRTSRAKSSLRRWLNNEGKIRSRDLGNELVAAEFAKLRIQKSYEEWLAVAAQAQGQTVESLLELIGNGSLSVSQMLHQMPADQTRPGKSTLMQRVGRLVTGEKGSPIKVENAGNLMIRFARCCMPVPGEKIVGFLTKGRGVAVHSLRCPNSTILATQAERKVAVTWNTQDRSHFRARVEVIAKNRINLLSELTHAISKFGSNIVNAHISTRENVVHDIFTVQVINLHQLRKIISALSKVKGVQRAARSRLEEKDAKNA